MLPWSFIRNDFLHKIPIIRQPTGFLCETIYIDLFETWYRAEQRPISFNIEHFSTRDKYLICQNSQNDILETL